MPVKIPDDLPAAKILQEENISVMPESRAFRQDIRPLRIAMVNIMPNKSLMETQVLRLLCNSPLQVAITFLHPRSHVSKNTAPEHLARFYKSFDEVRDDRFDCLIITGAPVGTLEFAAVTYWDELREIMDWSRSHVYSSLYLCWGAHAGLYHHYGIQKYALPRKISGVFEHRMTRPGSDLLHGFDDIFLVPHSRYAAVRREDILRTGSIEILAESERAGAYIISTRDNRQIFVTGHPEYDRLTLKEEYWRDRGKGLQILLPENYFPDDDLSRSPAINWRSHANLLFANWLHTVYQNAPFNLDDLEPLIV